MLSFDEARDRVLEAARLLDSEEVLLDDALGRVLREALVAREPLPPFDTSAMDGYAVRTADLGAGAWTLPVVGESRTGHVTGPLAPATAMRIFTGAQLPSGADAVVMQEDVERDGDRARGSTVPAPGAHVRRAGGDLLAGAQALPAGARLGPGALALCASVDATRVRVSRQPRVAIVCTGDELRPAGSAPRPGSIPESNGVALAAFVRQVGGQPRRLPLVGDDREQTTRAIADALQGSDLLLTVGGVSVGDHDLVRPALDAAGATLDFYKVRIKPGKPLTFGHAGSTLVFGLPGNPVSALVTFALFAAPLLRAMQGDSQLLPRVRRLPLLGSVERKPGRRTFMPARTSDDGVTPLTNQSSGAPTSIAWADALIDVDEDSESLSAGALVRVLDLSSV